MSLPVMMNSCARLLHPTSTNIMKLPTDSDAIQHTSPVGLTAATCEPYKQSDMVQVHAHVRCICMMHLTQCRQGNRIAETRVDDKGSLPAGCYSRSNEREPSSSSNASTSRYVGNAHPKHNWYMTHVCARVLQSNRRITASHADTSCKSGLAESKLNDGGNAWSARDAVIQSQVNQWMSHQMPAHDTAWQVRQKSFPVLFGHRVLMVEVLEALELGRPSWTL